MPETHLPACLAWQLKVLVSTHHTACVVAVCKALQHYCSSSNNSSFVGTMETKGQQAMHP